MTFISKTPFIAGKKKMLYIQSRVLYACKCLNVLFFLEGWDLEVILTDVGLLFLIMIYLQVCMWVC